MITEDYNKGPRVVRKDYILWKIQNINIIFIFRKIKSDRALKCECTDHNTMNAMYIVR